MKKKDEKFSRYYELPKDEVLTKEEKQLIESVDMERIHDMTLKHIHNDNKSQVLPFKRSFIKAAVILCMLIGIGSATVYASSNTAIKQVIGNVLGINQTEILTIGETIENKNYRLTVHEYASDSHVGTVIVSMEAISDKAKEMFKLNNNILLDKLGILGTIGYGMGFIEELEEANIKYLKIEFNASREVDYKDGLTFTMEGMRNKIKVPIIKTTLLKIKEIDVKESVSYPVNYSLMEYSELGFTLSGTVDTEKMNKNEIELNNQSITIDFVNGESVLFYYSYQEPKTMSMKDKIDDSIVSQNSDGSASVTRNTKEDKVYDEISIVNDEWFSGASTGGYHGDGKTTSIFSFSKKMDWSLVESITINDTKIAMD